MKKMLELKIFYFLLGALMFGGVGVYAGTLISSNDVMYTDSKTAKQAIDELYAKISTMYTKAEYDAHYEDGKSDGDVKHTIRLQMRPNDDTWPCYWKVTVDGVTVTETHYAHTKGQDYYYTWTY